MAWPAVARDDGAPMEFFEERVRPLLADHCYSCHSEDKARPKGNLRLDSREGWEEGGDSGAALVPGEPDRSLLIRAVRYADSELRMPPRGKLADDEIAALEAWVRMGAPDPRIAEPAAAAESAPPSPLDAGERSAIESAARSHWAFRPMADPAPPEVLDSAWCANGVDRFVLAELEARGLAPARSADRRTLLRRLSFDLTGLPPTEAEFAAFAADGAPGAWERQVDRLLASPGYGERMARFWLDLARYADSNGLDENLAMANAWRYRDWLVRAFVADLPYGRFIAEQIAGDLLPGPAPAEPEHDRFIATGFLVLGPKMLAEQDKQKLVADVVDEQIDVVSKTFLGLTVACARCHDHKFDPVSQRDYYALAGVFGSTSALANLDFVSRWREREIGSAEELGARAAHEAAVAAGEAALAAARAEADGKLAPAWHRDLAAYLAAGARAARRALFLEAEEFSRGNLIVDREQWGTPDVVVARTGAEGPQFAEYDVALADGGARRLFVRYAIDEPRPLRVLANGIEVAAAALAAATASDHPDGQTWAEVGVVRLEPGRNVLRLERDGPVPHLDKLLLVPEDADPFAGHGALAPAVVRSVADFLDQRERSTDPLFLPWRAYAELPDAEFGARATGVAERLRERRAAEKLAVSPLLAGVLDAPPPASLDELAARYQAALAAVGAAGDKPLDDAVAEEARRFLHEPAGPFALARSDIEALRAPADAEAIARAAAALDATRRAAPPPVPLALCVADGEAKDVPVHVRGSHLNLAPGAVPRGTAGFGSGLIDAAVAPVPVPASASGRAELARWLADPEHPLTSRVLANRIWQLHFGSGLVRSPSNFGLRGDVPSHPALLDFLARALVRGGGSIKALHRLIATSSTYRQAVLAAGANPRAEVLDPENRLVWRQNRRRLEAEMVRDALLAASGRLDRTMGGSLLRTENGGYVTNDQSANAAEFDSPRRALYLPVIRNAMYDMFAAFDYADPSTPLEQRPTSTVPHQALFLMNSPFAAECARALAERAAAEASAGDGAFVERAYALALCRAPTAGERAAAAAMLERAAAALAGTADGSAKARAGLCQVLLATNEFLHVE